MSKSNKQCYVSVPSQIINFLSSSSLQSLLLSPKKSSKSSKAKLLKNPRFWFFFLFLFGFLRMFFKMGLNLDPLIPFSQNPCSIPQQGASISNGYSDSQLNTVSFSEKNGGDVDRDEEHSGFWKQPDGSTESKAGRGSTGAATTSKSTTTNLAAKAAVKAI